VKVGVVGTGSMGRNHVRVLSELASLGGVCDVNKDTVERIAARFRTQPFQRIEDLLSSGVEAVSIVVPTAAHYENAKKAIEAGVHVLLEKPATGSIDKLTELSQLAESAKVTLAIGLIERHNPVVDFAAKNFRSKSFGSLICAHARRVSSFPARIKDIGVIMDLGVHDIDVIKYLVGVPAVRVYTVAGKFKHPEFEDYANITIEFENGTTGVVEVNWLTPMKVRRLSLTCSDQFVVLDYITQSAELNSSTIKEIDPENLFHLELELHSRRIHLKKEEPLRRELQDFIQACEKGSEPLVTGFDATETIRIAHEAAKSARERKIIEL